MKNYLDMKAFRKDLEQALAGVAQKYGVSIDGKLVVTPDDKHFEIMVKNSTLCMKML